MLVQVWGLPRCWGDRSVSIWCIQPWHDKVVFLQGDILAPGDLERVEDYPIDKIVHAAVFTGVLPEVEASRSRSIGDINVMGAADLLEMARPLTP